MRARIPLITAILFSFAITKGGISSEGCVYASKVQEQPAIVVIQPAEGNTVSASEADPEVIQANSATIGNQMSDVVDVAALSAVTAEQVISQINSYYIPDSCIYLDGAERKEGDLDYVIGRRNLAAVSDPVPVRYGVLTGNTPVRTYPSWQKLSDSLQENAFDYFQEGMFLIGEGVAVLHQTEDGIWSFVRGTNTAGWVETDRIAFCTREEMEAFAASENFVTVTEERLIVGEQEFRMGTRLPLARLEEDSAVVCLPKSNDNGNLYQTERKINLAGGIHIGNLELTADNIVRQAYKLLDMGYGYGDADGLLDDASALDAIYRCFGIILPDDSFRMMYAGISVTDISGMGAEEKEGFITEQEPGCILQMEGHAVLYMGLSEDKTPMILHSVAEYSPDGVNVTEAYKCVITPLDIYTPEGLNYLDSYQYVIRF